MHACTSDQWVDYLANTRCYATEYIYGNHSVMYHRLSQGDNVGMIIGEVHYCANGGRFYFILGEVAS